MKKVIIAINLIGWLVICSFDVVAQEEIAQAAPNELLSKKERRVQRRPKYLATQQIKALKNGALLVRLQTKKHTLEALRNAGKHDRANQVKTEQRLRNEWIVEAFQQEFDFCPTYFFFSDESEKIKKGDVNEVEFLNAKLEVDNSIIFDHGTFLTAEFGHVTQDTAQYFSNYRTNINGNWSVERVPAYYGGSNMGFGGLIIKSDRIIQLKKPFPYYVRTFNYIRGIDEAVKRMNMKLTRYYNRRVRKA